MSNKKAQKILDFHAYKCTKDIHGILSAARLKKAIKVIEGEQK